MRKIIEGEGPTNLAQCSLTWWTVTMSFSLLHHLHHQNTLPFSPIHTIHATLKSTLSFRLQYENSDLGVSALDLQGIVTYMSHVKAFVTGSKLKKPFLKVNQGIKVTSRLRISKIKNAWFQFNHWPVKIKRSREGAIKHTFCRSKILILVANTSIGDI